MSTIPEDPHALHNRYVRVGVYEERSSSVTVDITLVPGASVVLGSESDCTVPLDPSLGIPRHELIRDGRLLFFCDGMRLSMSNDEDTDRVADEVDQLKRSGLTSPTQLRWARMNIRLQPGLSVFIKYLRPGAVVDPG
ncbi:MAG: hypothetical protein R3A48_19435 [Polyangiales bacterium]